MQKWIVILVLGWSTTGLAMERVDLEQAASQVSADYIQQLGSVMKRQMETGGAEAAIKVCAESAPSISGKLSLEKGWQVRRVGTRVRNSMIGMPDEWEQKALAGFSVRRLAGEEFANMTSAEVVEEPNGRYFRFVRAIGVQPQCLACHGAADQIAEPVRQLIRQTYPHDRATGYKAGELRGAVSIKIPM